MAPYLSLPRCDRPAVLCVVWSCGARADDHYPRRTSRLASGLARRVLRAQHGRERKAKLCKLSCFHCSRDTVHVHVSQPQILHLTFTVAPRVVLNSNKLSECESKIRWGVGGIVCESRINALTPLPFGSITASKIRWGGLCVCAESLLVNPE